MSLHVVGRLALLAAVLVYLDAAPLACTSDAQHNYTWGEKKENSRVLGDLKIVLNDKKLNKVNVYYPSKGFPPNGTIAFIEVLDSRNDGTGGCARLLEGGPNKERFKVQLVAQTGKGFDFFIRVWGE